MPTVWCSFRLILAMAVATTGWSQRETTQPPEAVSAEWTALAAALAEAEAAAEAGLSVDWDALRAAVLEFAARHSSDPRAFEAALRYSDLVEIMQPEWIEAEWRRFADSPHPALARLGVDKLRFYDLTREPIRMTFTTIQDRRLDLERIRGRVVLVEFWTLDCAVCLAEREGLADLYRDFHDRGFVIVSVNLDPAEERERVLAHLSETGPNWPQQVDGRGRESPPARLFAVGRLPAMYLIDQDGYIVATGARSDSLENELRRLLVE